VCLDGPKPRGRERHQATLRGGSGGARREEEQGWSWSWRSTSEQVDVPMVLTEVKASPRPADIRCSSTAPKTSL
jgi:hypothetical protein